MDLRTVCLIVAIITLIVYLIVDREKETPDDDTEMLRRAAALKHKDRSAIAPLILNGIRRDKHIKGRSMARTETCPVYALPCTNNKTKSRKKKRK